MSRDASVETPEQAAGVWSSMLVMYMRPRVPSGGQIHELLMGRDRFCAAHPYDLCTSMLLEEAGGVLTDPWVGPLDCPLDSTSPVAWVGYANLALADRIGPILVEVLRDRLDR